MCIATIYIDDGSQREEVMKDVMFVDSEDGGILLTTILGEEKAVQASVRHIDFMKHSVVLAPSKKSTG